MGWFRLENDFSSHPKISAAGLFGEALFVRAIGYANGHETNGFVPTGMLMQMGWDIQKFENVEDIIDRLVTIDLLHVAPGGYEIHDFLVYQRSRESNETERERVREAMREARSRRKALQRNNGVSDEHVTQLTPSRSVGSNNKTTTTTDQPVTDMLQRNTRVTYSKEIYQEPCAYETILTDETIAFHAGKIAKLDAEFTDEWVRRRLRESYWDNGDINEAILLKRFVAASKAIQSVCKKIKNGYEIRETTARYAAGVFRRTMRGEDDE